MKFLCFIFFKFSTMTERMAWHIRGYYYSKLFKSCGKKRPRINHTVSIVTPQNIECGTNVIISPYCYLLASGGITLGDGVGLSAGAKIITSSLTMENGRILRKHTYKPVRLGNNVWLGTGAVVLPGVTIGENTIVAAGAVVNKDMPGDSIVAGVPAKVIRSLTVPESGS